MNAQVVMWIAPTIYLSDRTGLVEYQQQGAKSMASFASSFPVFGFNPF